MASKVTKWRDKNKKLLKYIEMEHSESLMDVDNENILTENNTSPEDGLMPDRNGTNTDRDTDVSPSPDSSQFCEQELSASEQSSYASSVSSDSSNNDVEINTRRLLPDLANWALSNGLSHSAINGLLEVLRTNVDNDIPKDSRTILKTPREVSYCKKCGGEYIYLGIKEGILRQPNIQFFIGEKISLKVNIDGLPLFKSSGMEVWPILGMIEKQTPFTIALFCGESKPTCLADFMKDFLEEYSILVQHGVKINDHMTKKFELKCFICDAPARAYLKCIKGHTGYHACERCTTPGEMHNGTMTFENVNSELRTDEKFSNFEYEEHQHELSILCQYRIPCVKFFVLDYMHLICLGVTRRILNHLKSGPRICKLSQRQIDTLSSRLSALRNTLPSEFARQPRSLKWLKRWKATEFKQFLLYTGMFVLKGVVDNDVYRHFLALSVSISVLMYFKPEDKNYMKLFNFTKNLLKWFVEKSSAIYGNSFVTYNVHSTIHLHQDVENFNCGLEDLSAFPFENFLHRIKKMVRKSHQPLPQITKRIQEMEENGVDFVSKVIKTKIKQKGDRDSWFLLTNNKICKILDVRNNEISARLFPFKKSRSYFSEPIDSKDLGICILPENTKHKDTIISKSDIKKKFVALPSKNGMLLIPMLHDLEL